MRGRSRERGFTLVELMIAVTLVGIMASIAIPGFQTYTYRTKSAERALVMLRIKQAIQDHYVRTGASVPGGDGNVTGAANPSLPPGPARRIMRTDLAGWNTYFDATGAGSSLPAEVQGGVYYSYSFSVTETPGRGATIWIAAVGDVDGDGVMSTKRFDGTLVNGTYQFTESPPAGLEDDEGPDKTF